MVKLSEHWRATAPVISRIVDPPEVMAQFRAQEAALREILSSNAHDQRRIRDEDIEKIRAVGRVPDGW